MPHKDPEARRVYQNEYHRRHREQQRAYNAEYRRINGRRPESPESMRRGNLRRLYGLTPEEYDAMFLAQEGLCAICGRPERRTYNGRLLRLSVDHDHVTGHIRALLCHGCNTAIGSLEDSVDLMQAALVYMGGWQ